LNTLSIILLFASLLNAYLASVSFRYYKSPGAITFGFFLITIVFYSFGYAFEIHADTLPEILFWLKIEYLGIPFFPTFLLIFSIQYIGKNQWLKPWFVGTLLTISAATTFVHFTSSTTHWFYVHTVIDNSGPFPLIHTDKGFWYWIHQGYSMISMVTFNVLFVLLFLQKDNLKRRQALLMHLSSLAPWICYLIYISGNSPFGIDLIPFSFILMGLVAAWGMFRYKLFDLEPLALENVFEYMSDSVIIVDAQGQIASYNKSAKAVFESLSVGLPVYNLSMFFPGLSGLVNTFDSQNTEVAVKTDGNIEYYEAKVSAIYDKYHQIIGKTLIFRDITERKQTELLLVNNQNRLKSLNQTKDKLISIIGHDLRGSIGNMYNLAVLLSDSPKEQTDLDRKHLAKILLNSSEQSKKLIETLMVWAKSQTGGILFKPQRFRLNGIIKETIEILQPIAIEKQIRIENTIGPNMNVYADSHMISLVVRNLLSNAIKFTGRNGHITLSAFSSEDETTVKIKDSGIGIPDEVRANLFNIDRNNRRNGTEHEPGTGLGLLLCKEFIDQHRGQLGVEDGSEQGSTFYFTIPY